MTSMRVTTPSSRQTQSMSRSRGPNPPLPPDANAGSAADDEYVKEHCTQVNAMGIDMWKIDFPDREAADFH